MLRKLIKIELSTIVLFTMTDNDLRSIGLKHDFQVVNLTKSKYQSHV